MDFLLRPVGQGNNDPIVTIFPSAGFVIKSKLISVQNRPNNSISLKPDFKIFINVCYDDKVPKPEIDFDPNVVYPLIMENQWEIPIITSSIREDKDKKGMLCYVADCCINTICMDWINLNVQLREILVEWCVESCELSDMIEISRENIAFPKMKKKGEIPPLEILSNVLQNDYKKDMNSFMGNKKEDPVNIIKLRRDLIEDDAFDSLDTTGEGELPPLFPVTDNTSKFKPLIQEIDELSINEIQSDTPRFNIGPKDLEFKVNIRKTRDSEKYKLRIEVESELQSESDIKLHYEKTNNSLMITNANLTLFKPKSLEIPLPNIFSENDIASMTCFFVISEKKLVIFI